MLLNLERDEVSRNIWSKIDDARFFHLQKNESHGKVATSFKKGRLGMAKESTDNHVLCMPGRSTTGRLSYRASFARVSQ